MFTKREKSREIPSFQAIRWQFQSYRWIFQAVKSAVLAGCRWNQDQHYKWLWYWFGIKIRNLDHFKESWYCNEQTLLLWFVVTCLLCIVFFCTFIYVTLKIILKGIFSNFFFSILKLFNILEVFIDAIYSLDHFNFDGIGTYAYYTIYTIPNLNGMEIRYSKTSLLMLQSVTFFLQTSWKRCVN